MLERSKVGRALWVRIGEGEWLSARRLISPRPPEAPPGIGVDERWIDVDLEGQILTAYEGSRAVYTTLVSSGRGGSATPRGTFRIWAKLATGEMSDDGGDDIDASPYLMQGVPWVMYFNEGVALHGAYWHDRFGQRRSHGCVNLAPRDAAWVFGWARPRLPPGWEGVLPTRTEPGTIVVVR
jgi:lipoprotein-anchoring transpeptidase ErfK/SrfK